MRHKCEYHMQFYLALIVCASLSVMAEAHVGPRVVFDACMCGLAGAQKPEIVSRESGVM